MNNRELAIIIKKKRKHSNLNNNSNDNERLFGTIQLAMSTIKNFKIVASKTGVETFLFNFIKVNNNNNE